MRAHGEVWAFHRRAQIGIGGARATPDPDRHVEASESFLLIAIDVGRPRIAGLLAGREPGRVQRIRQRAVSRLQRTRIAAVGIAAFGARLGTAEIRQHRGIVPARGALRLPALEVLRVAAHVNEAIDGGRAAEHLAARCMEAASAEPRFRFGVVTPVVLRHAHRDRKRRGHLHEDRAVGTTVLEQEDRVLAVFREPVRQHAARGSCSHDDVVKRLSRAHRCRPSRRKRSSAGCNAPSRRGRSRARVPRA